VYTHLSIHICLSISIAGRSLTRRCGLVRRDSLYIYIYIYIVNGFLSVYIYLSIHISIYIYLSIYTSTAFTHSTLRFDSKRFFYMWVSPYIHSYTHIYIGMRTHIYRSLSVCLSISIAGRSLTRRCGLVRRDSLYIYI